jgi:hypothetical protein
MSLFQELNGAEAGWQWPLLSNAHGRPPERVLVFESAGGRALTLASNSPYELWLDGCFIGDGGHSCVRGEALADHWEETATATLVQVRLHWIDSEQSSVLYRCLFDDPFLAHWPSGQSWTCWIDDSICFAAPMSAQLPRQNIVTGPRRAGPALSLQPLASPLPWKILHPPIHKSRYVAVALRPGRSLRLEGRGPGPFGPEQADNVARYVREDRPCALQCDTYDLGRIALHRFEVDAGRGACVLYYSEVANFEEVGSTPYRTKVHLADAVSAGVPAAAPFGTRGCRYVHVLYEPEDGARPAVRAWRREYPLEWKPVRVESGCAGIVDACRANLIACVDGGVVDTCWRERAQWTGDLRMSALALRALADNSEVVDLALHQIAQSYNPRTGMVNGAWPILRPHADFPIPPYHLAFCLAAVEQDPSLQRDPLVRHVVLDSLERWKRSYLHDGLLRGMPGWYFTDWDPTDLTTAGRGKPYSGPHAVCNAWWTELCDRIAPEAGIRSAAFDRTFWTGRAYSLTTDRSLDSPHATAAALNSSVGRGHVAEGLRYLEEEIGSGRITARVTAYYAYFVAQAFARHSRERALAFIQDFYGPIAQTYGTIYEKTSGDASLAHGWSVAVASLCLTDSGDQTAIPN